MKLSTKLKLQSRRCFATNLRALSRSELKKPGWVDNLIWTWQRCQQGQTGPPHPPPAMQKRRFCCPGAKPWEGCWHVTQSRWIDNCLLHKRCSEQTTEARRCVKCHYILQMGKRAPACSFTSPKVQPCVLLASRQGVQASESTLLSLQSPLEGKTWMK